jgi:hypothetical protein
MELPSDIHPATVGRDSRVGPGRWTKAVDQDGGIGVAGRRNGRQRSSPVNVCWRHSGRAPQQRQRFAEKPGPSDRQIGKWRGAVPLRAGDWGGPRPWPTSPSPHLPTSPPGFSTRRGGEACSHPSSPSSPQHTAEHMTASGLGRPCQCSSSLIRAWFLNVYSTFALGPYPLRPTAG